MSDVSIDRPNFAFSSSSVPVAFFGALRLSDTNNLGKRKRNPTGQRIVIQEHNKDLPPRKRRRINPPEDCNCCWHSYPPIPRERPSTPQPWHQNDRFVRQLPREELLALVEPSNQEAIPNPFHQLLFTNLTNPIHPLLRPLIGLANTLPFLATSLRLATKFLISPHTLPFFHNLITAPLTLLQAESISSTSL